MGELVRTKAVAEAVGLDEETIRGYAREGRIPYTETPGGHRRFDLPAVQAALATEIARRRRAAFPEGARQVAPVQWGARRSLAYRLEDEIPAAPAPASPRFPGVPGTVRILTPRDLVTA